MPVNHESEFSRKTTHSAVIVIPARFHSTRFPGKLTQSLRGKPLLSWVLHTCVKLKDSADIILATDDERIAKIGRESDVEVIITDSELPSGTDRVNAALNGRSYDWVLNVQGDEPLVKSEDLERLLTTLSAGKARIVTLARPLNLDDLSDKNTVKVLCNRDGYATYFSRFPVPFSRSQPLDKGGLSSSKLLGQHVGVYGYSLSALKAYCQYGQGFAERHEGLEQLRALEMGLEVGVLWTQALYYGVDTPQDMEKVETLLKLESE